MDIFERSENNRINDLNGLLRTQGATASVTLCPVVEAAKIQEIDFFENSKLGSVCSSAASGGDSTLNSGYNVDEEDTCSFIRNSTEIDFMPPLLTYAQIQKCINGF